MAYESRNKELEVGKTHVSEVIPLMADGEIGYAYFVTDPSKNNHLVKMLFNSGNTFYQIILEGIVYDNNKMNLFSDRLNKIQTSIKFFN